MTAGTPWSAPSVLWVVKAPGASRSPGEQIFTGPQEWSAFLGDREVEVPGRTAERTPGRVALGAGLSGGCPRRSAREAGSDLLTGSQPG